MSPHSSPRRLLLHQAAATSLGWSLPRVSAAQSTLTPAALRLLCTAPAGSIPDTVARRYAQAMKPRYPGGIAVDNRVGAAGRIAVAALKQSAPDGGTLLLAQGAIATVYPYLYTHLTYDAAADLRPVSMAAETTLALAVGAKVPSSVTTLQQLVGWLRQHPQDANYGSPGIGTLPHLLGAAFVHAAQMDVQHVAYPGGPAAMVDLLGGRLALLVLPEGLLRQHHDSGRLRVLATSGSGRSAELPAVPTFSEQGWPGLVVREWFAFFMPGATPAAVVEASSQAIRAAALQPALVADLAGSAMTAVTSTPAALVARIADEQRYWQALLAATGIRAE